jgi:hypothetical protein
MQPTLRAALRAKRLLLTALLSGELFVDPFHNALAWSVGLAVAVIAFCLAFPAAGHERNNPSLDGWYESLRRPQPGQGALPCCSRRDCHRTDAELRPDGWYARLGVPTWPELTNRAFL